MMLAWQAKQIIKFNVYLCFQLTCHEREREQEGDLKTLQKESVMMGRQNGDPFAAFVKNSINTARAKAET